MIPRPYPQPIDPITVGLSPLGTDDSNILQLEQAVNNLVTQFNLLVEKEKILQQELNYVRSLISTGYVTAAELSAALAAYAGTRNLVTAGSLNVLELLYTQASSIFTIGSTGGDIDIVTPSGHSVNVSNNFTAAGAITVGAGGLFASSGNGGLQGATVNGTLVFEDGLYVSGFPTGGTAGEFVGVTSGGGLGYATLDGTIDQITITAGSGTFTFSLSSTLVAPGTIKPASAGGYLAHDGSVGASATTGGATFVDGLYISGAISGGGGGGDVEDVDTTTGLLFVREAQGTGNPGVWYNLDLWPGSAEITSLGTIGTGVWEGTAIGNVYGGTGLNSSSAADGELLIGTGSGLTLATLTGTGNEITVTNSSGGITLSLPSTLHLGTITTGTWQGGVIGSSYIANLPESQITDLVSDLTDRLVIANNLSEISAEGPTAMATARTNIGLGNVQNIDITAYAGNTNTTHLGTISFGTWQGSVIAVAYGGTGTGSSPANGQLLIGNGSGYTLANITGSNGIGIANGSGTIGLSLGTITGAVWNGTTVQIAYGGTGATTAAGACTALGALQLSNDLSELSSSASTARSNLGLGSAATHASTDFVSAAGTLSTSNGGTGLTSIGTAGQVLAVNSGATGLTWVTNTAFADVTNSGSYARTMGAWQQIEGTANQIAVTASGGSLLFAIASPCTMPGNLNFGSSGYSISSTGNASLNAMQAVNVIATGLLRAPFIIPMANSTTTFQMRTAGNVSYVNFDSTNLRVGIGNNFTNPAYTLDVAGTFNVSGNAQFQSLISTPLILPTVDANGIKIRGIANGVAIMQFDCVNNRVGVGSPAPTPAYTLDVAGDVNVSGWVSAPIIYPYADGTSGLQILKASNGAPVCRFDTANQIVYPNRLVLPTG